jgi:hypothetical protein
MIKITIGDPEPHATVELKARRALDGSLLIMDHNKIDIAVMPKQMKITTIPKTNTSEDVYPYQDRLLELLEAVIFENDDINSLQAATYVIAEFIKYEAEHEKIADEYEKELEDMYTHPTDQDSTEYGEVPQGAEKGSMRPGYYYSPLRNRY